MNRWRQKHPDFGKANYGKTAKKDSTYGELSDDKDVSEAADGIYDVAAQHRDGVIARDKAAAARRKKGTRRG